MGNKPLICFLFSLVIVFFIGNNSALADACPVTQLSYCFKNNVSGSKCVKANSTAQAQKLCGYVPSVWQLNNPIYKLGVTQNTWLCSSNSTKEKICTTADPKYKLKWKPTGGGDGYCYQDDKAVTDTCDVNDLAHEIKDNEENGCVGSLKLGPDGRKCVCNTEAGYKDGAGGSCVKDEVAKKPVEIPPSKGVPQVVKDCAVSYVNDANSCKESTEQGQKFCDKENKSNAQYSQLANIPASIAQQFAQAAAASGNVAECMKAGVIANSTKPIVNELIQKCDVQTKICQGTCKPNMGQEMANKCGLLAREAEGIDQRDDLSPESTQFLAETRKSIEDAVSEGVKICNSEMPQGRSNMDQLLTSAAQSVLGAAKCSCQFAASMAGVATGASCTASSGIVDVCTMGSASYNASACNCVLNPAAQGCAGYVQAAVQGDSGFAGAAIPGTDTSAGFGIGDSSGGAAGTGDLNLGSQTPDEIAAVGKPNTTGPAFNAGGGGAGGGGASAPSGGGEPGMNNGGEAGEGKGLGQLFNQAKSFVSSLLGGNKSGTVGSGLKVNPDMGKFRPSGLRGVASSGLGGKNTTIWQLANDRYDQIRPTFIQTP